MHRHRSAEGSAGGGSRRAVELKAADRRPLRRGVEKRGEKEKKEEEEGRGLVSPAPPPSLPWTG